MPKRKTEVIEHFGERLAELRKAAGYTQVEFAAELAITQRMVALRGARRPSPGPSATANGSGAGDRCRGVTRDRAATARQEARD